MVSERRCLGRLCRYLSFVQGIVDSDTLPLQVSRESLQQHAALKTIKKKLVRKTLDMIRKLADAETSFEAEDADRMLHFYCWLCLHVCLTNTAWDLLSLCMSSRHSFCCSCLKVQR